MRDSRSLTLGIVLSAIGLFFLLRRTIGFSGPGPILVLIGAILLAASALRGFRGPVVPGAVLVGLGAGFLLQAPLERLLPRWATLLLGLSGGFFLAAGLERASGRERLPAPTAAVVLLVVAVGAAVARRRDIGQIFAALAGVWPWIVIAAGLVLVVTALRGRTVKR